MKNYKRFLGILLTALMLMSMLTVNAFAAGSQSDPINSNDKWFGYGVNCFLMNTDLAAGNTEGVWYELTADADGILQVEHSYKDIDYTLTVYANGIQQTIDWEDLTFSSYNSVLNG